jgi:hypothetical protein
MDLISKRTRIEFREYFVGTSLAIIRDAFEVADIACSDVVICGIDGERRILVEQYYRSIDWGDPGDVAKVLHVYENVLTGLEHRADAAMDNTYLTIKEQLEDWLKRDGYQLQDGRLRRPGHLPILAGVLMAATRLTLPEMLKQVERMQAAVDEDPGLAVGTAKELLETTCKFILAERGSLPDASPDVPQLVRATAKALKLLPDDIPDAAKGAESIRRVLSSVTQIASGVAELRNLYGTGHGRDGKRRGLLPRHARFVVTSVAAASTFLLETHEARQRST